MFDKGMEKRVICRVLNHKKMFITFVLVPFLCDLFFLALFFCTFLR